MLELLQEFLKGFSVELTHVSVINGRHRERSASFDTGLVLVLLVKFDSKSVNAELRESFRIGGKFRF